mgnify:CR=1 FL=1
MICTEWERCDSSSRDWPTPVAVDMDQSVYDSESYDMSHSKESESSGTLYLGWMKGVDSQNQPSESNSSVPHSHEVSEEEMSSQSEEGSSLGEEHPMGTSSMLDDADLLNESTVAPLSSSSEIPSEMSESGDEEPVQQESNENQVSITEVKEQNNLLRTLLHEVRQGGMPQQSEFHFSTCDDDLSGPLSDTHYAFTVAEEKAVDPVSDEAAETHRVLVALDSAIESSRLTDMDSLSASPSWGESPKASEEASPKEAPKESPKESPRASPKEEKPLDWSVLKEEEGDYVKSVFMRAEDSMMECEASPKEEEEREKEACVKEEEWRMSDLSDSVIVSDESEEEVEEKKSEDCVVESEESEEKNEEEVEKQKSEECVVESEESDGDVMEKQTSECVIEKKQSEECVVESEKSASAGSREDSKEKEDTEDSVQEEVRVEEEKEPSLTPLAEPEEEEMPSDSVSEEEKISCSVSEEEKISYSVSEEEKPSSSLSEEEKPSEATSEEEKPESTSEEEKHSNSVSEECIDLISDSSSNASPAPIPPTIPSPILPFPDPDAPAEQPQSPPPFYNNDAFKPRFTLDQINETLSVFDTVSTKRPAVVATEAEQASEEVESKLKQRESAGEK